MDDRVAEANRLSREDKDEEALEILHGVLVDQPDSGAANLACACALDGLGREREAIPHYERAIENGLSGDDLEEATISLGSSYRAIGEYAKAVEVWREGQARYPENRALQAFLAMGLYNLGEHKEAMEILLRTLAETSSDPWMVGYKPAITFYSDNLDETWPG